MEDPEAARLKRLAAEARQLHRDNHRPTAKEMVDLFTSQSDEDYAAFVSRDNTQEEGD